MAPGLSRRSRDWGSLVVIGVGVLVACSVDTGDITFEKDHVFYGPGNGGIANVGGIGNIGGVANIAGVLNKAGADSKAGDTGSGGASTGGSKQMGGTDAGGKGMGGGPPVCSPGVADRLQGEVDNLEDGDGGIPMNAGRHGGWYTFNDTTGPQMPAPMLPMSPEQTMAAMGTDYAIHTRGGPFTDWGGGVGIVLNAYPDKPPCAYDISPHAGLRFWARGMNTSPQLRVQLATLQTQLPAQGGTCVPVGAKICGDHFGYIFPLTPNWQLVEVTWAELQQQSGMLEPFDPASVLNIEFSVPRNVTFDFWVDQVAFY